MYQSTKRYGHDVGISCAFRQWRATHSHCSKLHGYALAFTFVFESTTLDDRNWVVDFGGLKELKARLLSCFDHKTVIAQDDPLMNHFLKLRDLGAMDVTIMENVGCEMFAKEAFSICNSVLSEMGLTNDARLLSVTVNEHGANSAVYFG